MLNVQDIIDVATLWLSKEFVFQLNAEKWLFSGTYFLPGGPFTNMG